MPPKAISKQSTAHQADSSHLLPFQRNLLAQLLPPPDTAITTGDALLILARGLGLRSIVATLVHLSRAIRPRPSGSETDLFESNRLQLRIYDTSDHLVLLVNATSEEEKGFAEELGMRIKVVGHELPSATR